MAVFNWTARLVVFKAIMLAGIWELKGRARGEMVQRLAFGSLHCSELVKRKGLLKETRAAVG